MVGGVSDDQKIDGLKELLDTSGFYDSLGDDCKDNKKDCKIVIKPNISIATQKDTPNYTDPDLVNWLVDDLHDRGYETVRIVESNNMMYLLEPRHSPDIISKNIGYTHPVKNLSEDDVKIILHEDRTIPIARTMLDADFIINFPKGRNHPQRKMTGAIKNMFGTLPVTDKLFHYHYEGSGFTVEEVTTAVHEITPPNFTIVDMLKSVDGRDEHVSTERMTEFVEPQLLLAGRDALTIDKILATKMGYAQNEPPMTKEMLKHKKDFDACDLLRGGDCSRIIVDGREWRKVPLSTEILWKFGIDTVLRELLKIDFVKDQMKKVGNVFLIDVV